MPFHAWKQAQGCRVIYNGFLQKECSLNGFPGVLIEKVGYASDARKIQLNYRDTMMLKPNNRV
jgi:hypothetical protein